MSATQKYAWYSLVISVLTLVGFAALCPLLGRGAFSAFSLTSLWVFAPLFFRKRPGQVVADERDHLIWRRSVQVMFAVFWLALVTAVMLAWFVYGPEGSVPVWLLMSGLMIGMVIILGTQAVALLVQYRWGA
jgi:hypothetical protein